MSSERERLARCGGGSYAQRQHVVGTTTIIPSKWLLSKASASASRAGGAVDRPADEPTEIPGLNGATLESIYDHVFGNDARHVGGVLVGRIAGQGPPRVTGAIAALDASGASSDLVFTHEMWQRIHREMDTLHPDDQLVGWYHSHPGTGIFLSEHEQAIHRTFFSGESQIVLVIDPQNETEGLFCWTSDELRLISERDCLSSGTSTNHAPPPSPLRAFLCHSSADKEAVRNLHRRLKADGFSPWLDEEDLLAGQDWELSPRLCVRATLSLFACRTRQSRGPVTFTGRSVKR